MLSSPAHHATTQNPFRNISVPTWGPCTMLYPYRVTDRTINTLLSCLHPLVSCYTSIGHPLCATSVEWHIPHRGGGAWDMPIPESIRKPTWSHALVLFAPDCSEHNAPQLWSTELNYSRKVTRTLLVRKSRWFVVCDGWLLSGATFSATFSTYVLPESTYCILAT